MSNLILFSVALITLALILYSTAVWLNWRSRRLTFTYIAIFWVAVACDALATRFMGLRVETIRWDLHTISGYLALALMAALTLWGTVALLQKRDDRLARFHTVAIPIWIIWAGSYITGVYLGIQRVSGGA
jgi:uncharacterized repeat protein (TIGR03987 family)